MFVCVCNALTETQVREAIDSGVDTAPAVYEWLGCEPQCGRCRQEIASLLMAPKGAASGAD